MKKTTPSLTNIPLPLVRTQGVVSRLLDELQGRGRLVASLDELATMSGLTPLAVRRQLEHLAESVFLSLQ